MKPLTLLVSTLLQRGTAQCHERPWRVISSLGVKWEHVSGSLAFPAVWDAAKKTCFFLAPSRILRCASSLGCRVWLLGKEQQGLLEDIKEKWILLTTLQTPLGNSPTRHWANPNWPTVILVFCAPHPYILSACDQFCMHTLTAVRWNLYQWLVSAQKASPVLQDWEKPHKLDHLAPP